MISYGKFNLSALVACDCEITVSVEINERQANLGTKPPLIDIMTWTNLETMTARKII
jgi:hypothetical protein